MSDIRIPYGWRTVLSCIFLLAGGLLMGLNVIGLGVGCLLVAFVCLCSALLGYINQAAAGDGKPWSES